MWQLIYRADKLTDVAKGISHSDAVHGFVVGLGIPAAVLLTFGGAAAAEPYPTIEAYLGSVLFGLILGAIGAAFMLWVPFGLFWLLSTLKTRRIAVLGRMLLISPLMVFVPLMIWTTSGGLSEANSPGFFFPGVTAPAWLQSPVIAGAGSLYVLTGIAVFWLGMTSVALFRVLTMPSIY